MNFWERNRKLIAAVIVAAIAAVVVHFVVVSPRYSESARIEEEENSALRQEIAGINRDGGLDVPAALSRREERRKALDDVIKGMDNVLLVIPDGSRFRVPASRRNDAKFYFQEQQNRLFEERCAGGQYPAKGVLGFLQDMYDSESAELLLERLAAVDRLTAAVNRAGVTRVRQIRHLKTTIHSAKGVKDAYLELLPMTVEMVADERATIEFLSEISRDGAYMALDGLDMQVTDAKSRTVTITAALSALVLRHKAPPKSTGGPGIRGPAVGRY